MEIAAVLRKDRPMPRQRIHHSRVTYQVPDDFPERLVRFKEESDLPWAEIRPASRRPSTRQCEALEGKGTCSPKHTQNYDGAPGKSTRLAGPGPPVQRLSEDGAPVRGRVRIGTETPKGRHTWLPESSPSSAPVTFALPYGNGFASSWRRPRRRSRSRTARRAHAGGERPRGDGPTTEFRRWRPSSRSAPSVGSLRHPGPPRPRNEGPAR